MFMRQNFWVVHVNNREGLARGREPVLHLAEGVLRNRQEAVGRRYGTPCYQRRASRAANEPVVPAASGMTFWPRGHPGCLRSSRQESSNTDWRKWSPLRAERDLTSARMALRRPKRIAYKLIVLKNCSPRPIVLWFALCVLPRARLS